MVRGDATLNFSGQICQAEMSAIAIFFRGGRAACVHSAVEAPDKDGLCLRNCTYPQVWIIFLAAPAFFQQDDEFP
jgi:hypothetical protein